MSLTNSAICQIRNTSVIIVCMAAFLLIGPDRTHADELPEVHSEAAELLPSTTIGYLEISRPAHLMSAILDHPLTHQIEQLEAYQKATQSQEYRSFLTGRKFFELQIGADWRPAVEALTEMGIFIGYDAATNGTIALIRGRDVTTMENFRTKILELTRLGGEKAKPEDYRGVSVYKLDKGGAAVIGEWMIVTNNAELGRGVVDRLMDGRVSHGTDSEAPDSQAPDSQAPDSDAERLDAAPVSDKDSDLSPATLAQSADFLAARGTRSKGSLIWAYGDLASLRAAGVAQKMFEGQSENPLAELLFGGIQSILQQAPFITSELQVQTTGLDFRLALPWQSEWVPEHRVYFFGLEDSGLAPAVPELPETLLTFSAWRDVSDMWLRAGDLFDEQMNDQIAEADSNLSTVFAGRDFGEDILGAIEPQLSFIVTRQSFDNVMPVPAIKLPAFALVATLRDPETMRAELRRTFQSAVGFFNIVGAQQGNPQLELDMQKTGDVDLVTSRYVPEKKDRDSTTAALFFNFSPSVGFSGDRFVLASTAELAKQLADTPGGDPEAGVNTRLVLNAPVLHTLLADNREQLTAQNMLQDGHTREEAESSIELLLQIVTWFRGAELKLVRENEQLAVRLSVSLNDMPEMPRSDEPAAEN